MMRTVKVKGEKERKKSRSEEINLIKFQHSFSSFDEFKIQPEEISRQSSSITLACLMCDLVQCCPICSKVIWFFSHFETFVSIAIKYWKKSKFDHAIATVCFHTLSTLLHYWILWYFFHVILQAIVVHIDDVLFLISSLLFSIALNMVMS